MLSGKFSLVKIKFCEPLVVASDVFKVIFIELGSLSSKVRASISSSNS